MTISPARVLLTGGRAPVTLELARMLHGEGCQVYVAESAEYHLCRVSSAVAASFRVPAPRSDPEGYMAALAALIERCRIDLLVPMCEEIFYIAAGMARLPQRCRVLADKLGLLAQLHHKHSFIRLAEHHGCSVPATRLLTGAAQWRQAATEAQAGALVLKPAYSRFAAQVLLPQQLRAPRGDTRRGCASAGLDGADGVEAERAHGDGAKRQPAGLAHTEGGDRQLADRASAIGGSPASEAAPVPRGLSPERPWVAQRYVPGRAICTFSLLHRGRLLAHAAYESKYRTGSVGASVHFKQLEHPGALSWVSRFAAATGLSGHIGMDFIDGEDGILYAIECNPRATSGLHLFRSVAAEYVAALLSPEPPLPEPLLPGPPLLEQPPGAGPLQPPPGSKAMLTLPMAACGLRLAAQPRQWGAWLGAWRGTPDAVYRRGDPRPAWEQLRIVADAWRRSRRSGLRMTEVLTDDIEWNGER